MTANLAAAFVDPIDQPAQPSALAARSPLLAITRAGNRVVAVGARGHIVYSDDNAGTWRQAAVPVSVDLTGVSFPREKIGWAVGHAGVVLATRDGGATWTKQLVGKQDGAARGAAQPFLDVFFESDTSGFVVGAFNTIFRTEDGGKSWVPWMERTSNPEELHFYAVRARDGRVFLAGEQGKVWRLLPGANRFVPIETPYKGTFFGLILVHPATVLAFGMRGAVYRSADNGETWHKITVRTGAGVAAGTALADGRIVLVDQGGGLHVSTDGGKSFAARRMERPMACYGLAAGGNGTVIVSGAAGIARVALP
ncbi:MAG TPA: YCF48-related protein [Usitatibacter sp.]|nr:YCF48-related protein [Usitatibacter sp.]